MKVLVIGAAGYIGSHCLRQLEAFGHTPVVLDNLVFGHRSAVPGHLPFYDGDLGDPSLLERIFETEKIDVVMHFAAFAYVGESVTDPLKYYDNNFARPVVLLQTMRKFGVTKFVFSSTCATYGIPDRLPITEDLPQRPINPYGQTKLDVETMLKACASAYGLSFAAFRYFNAAGAAEDGSIGEDHDPETHLIPLVIDAATGRRECVTVFGDDYPTPDGTCLRDYVHVDDLSRAHIAAFSKLSAPGVQLFYNLGFERTFGRSPEARAYAPGRIEFIGNHTDYNGGCALGAAVDRGITVAIATRSDGECHFVSESMNGEVVAALDNVTPLANPFAWVNYPLGVIHVMRQEGLPVERGMDLAVASSLPAGAGMSSSAAFELATAYGLAALNGFEVDRKKMVQVCRRAENEFVGMPCGILDQGTSAFGAPDHLVHVDCLTETFTRVPMPSSCHLWIFNSNKKHSLVDSKYSERHRECSEAFEILQRAEPKAACLAHVSPITVRAQQRELGEVHFRRALHITEENVRVKEAVEALKSGRLEVLGALLTASHQSSRTLFENSCAELDYLVERLTDLPGVYGARLTGGGFGGAVMALTGAKFEELEGPARITSCYTKNFGIKPTVFHTRAGDGAGPLIS